MVRSDLASKTDWTRRATTKQTFSCYWVSHWSLQRLSLKGSKEMKCVQEGHQHQYWFLKNSIFQRALFLPFGKTLAFCREVAQNNLLVTRFGLWKRERVEEIITNRALTRFLHGGEWSYLKFVFSLWLSLDCLFSCLHCLCSVWRFRVRSLSDTCLESHGCVIGRGKHVPCSCLRRWSEHRYSLSLFLHSRPKGARWWWMALRLDENNWAVEVTSNGVAMFSATIICPQQWSTQSLPSAPTFLPNKSPK